MSETLRAVEVAEEILNLITLVAPEEISEALDKLNIAGATWGILWGLEDVARSSVDLDFYLVECLKMVLEKVVRLKDPGYCADDIKDLPTVVRALGEAAEIAYSDKYGGREP